MSYCIALGCVNPVTHDQRFCSSCAGTLVRSKLVEPSLPQLYPKYYKNVDGLTEVDVYAVHQLFNIQDPSGAIQHASKKLLLSGVRTGGKSKRDDIREARDTLNRWLQLDEQLNPA